MISSVTRLLVLLLIWALTCGSDANAGEKAKAALPGEKTRPRLMPQLGHERFLSTVFSPDGKQILTRGGRLAVLWDTASGLEIIRFVGHTFDVTSAVFSPNGNQILTASGDKTARIWEKATGLETVRFQGHASDVWSAVFSPDGKQVLTTSRGDNTSRLWNAASGKEIVWLQGFASGHDADLSPPAFSPDGKQVLTASSDRKARLWDAASGREIVRLEGHTDRIRSAVFSSDGKQVLTASKDNTARVWDAASGKVIVRLPLPSKLVCPAVFSPDGNKVLTASQDKIARLWNVANGKLIARFQGHSLPLRSAVFSPDGTTVLTASADGTARLWTLTGQEIVRYPGNLQAVFSPDGRWVLAATSIDSTARLYELLSGQEIVRFQGITPAVKRAVFSPNGKHILTASSQQAFLWDVVGGRQSMSFLGRNSKASFSPDGRQVLIQTTDLKHTAHLWDTVSGKEIGQFPGQMLGPTESGRPLAPSRFSPDGKQVLTASYDKTVRLWDIANGKEILRLQGHTADVFAMEFSRNGKQVLTVSYDKTARLWNAASGKESVRIQGHPDTFWAALSPDSKQILTGQETVRLWNAATGKETFRIQARVEAHPWSFSPAFVATFSPDGSQVLIPAGVRWKYSNASEAPLTRLWDAASGKEIARFPGEAATYSPDGKQVLTANRGGILRLYDSANGKEILRFQDVHMIDLDDPDYPLPEFSPDGKLLLTVGDDGTTRLWDVATGKELSQLISFQSGGWAVVAPDGRFDTDNLDEIKGIHWLMPDEPYTPLSPELFMREYYEPRLLPRILVGEKFEPVRSLASLNRVQPAVKIDSIEPEPGTMDEVIVTVTVTGQARTIAGQVFHSGAQDVQLFRDGQLVATQGAIKLDKTNRSSIRFEHIRLPRIAGKKEIEFTAYAFNSDQVKSPTARVLHPLLAGLKVRPRTAYVIAVGVNSFDDARLNLRYAVPDANTLAETMQQTLTAQKQFERVVVVPLLADSAVKDGKRIFTERTATKATIQAILGVLAGKKPDGELLKQVPNVNALAPARPEDLVLISFSTHGHNGKDGQFHLLPSDSQQTISTDDLSRWLRDIDAGEMILIVDACHSAGAIEQKGFKPGPMGSRGFGQLAYNKRMRILAASQASDVAFEDARLGHGLLTYALIDDGLKKKLADFSPKDGRIQLGEWLRYGVQRVPVLVDEIAAGKRRALSSNGRNLVLPKVKRGFVLDFEGEVKQLQGLAQQPALFDFTRHGDGLVLTGNKMP